MKTSPLLWAALLPLATNAACAVDGSDYSYVESVSTGAVPETRNITYNSCPNHVWTSLNSNEPLDVSRTISIPKYPRFVGPISATSIDSASVSLAAQGGLIGVLFDGAHIYSPYDGTNTVTSYSDTATAKEGNTFDQCGEHASPQAGSYHAHIPPPCLLAQLGQTDSAHSPQIGWAADGFPVYGPRGPGGVMMQTCTVTTGTYGTDVCTDECGGYYNIGAIDGYAYRYYMQGTYHDGSICTTPTANLPGEEYHPHSPMCLRGCCPVLGTGNRDFPVDCVSWLPQCSGTTPNSFTNCPNNVAKLDLCKGTSDGFGPAAIAAKAVSTTCETTDSNSDSAGVRRTAGLVACPASLATAAILLMLAVVPMMMQPTF